MTRGVHVLNRVLLTLLGLVLLTGAAVLAAAAAGTSLRGVARAGALWQDGADGVRSSVAGAVSSTSPATVTAAGAVLAGLLAVLAVAWVAAQRRGRARTALMLSSAAPDAVPGEVVVTASAVEGLVHGLVRTGPDTLAASVTAVRRGRPDRRTPHYDVVVAPRRGADPVAVATAAGAAADDAGRLLGVPVDRTVRLRASAVRRLRKPRRVS